MERGYRHYGPELEINNVGLARAMIYDTTRRCVHLGLGGRTVVLDQVL